jgi:biopolymer transport protein ExbD/biopolymer transport protein TolR
MGMNNAGSPNQAVSGINVTPLIDVLLVLLIIFMVIVPVTPRGLAALVPQPPKSSEPIPPDTPIVVQVLGTEANPSYKINEESVPHASLQARLAVIFAARQEKVMFVKGDAGVDYARVADVIDLGRGVGVENVGLVTTRTLADR